MPVRKLYGVRHWSVTGRRAPGYRSEDAAVRLTGRNLLFFSLAAVFCAQKNIPEIHVGTLKANPFSDASPDFLQTAAGTASTALKRPLKIIAPFRQLSKKEVVALGRGLPLRLTFSCLSPRGLRPCRRCNKCAERDKALKGM
jgi:7-cyano-7-deazaguanine synthase in queuosine biosynthesis